VVIEAAVMTALHAISGRQRIGRDGFVGGHGMASRGL
jgi:hypothetical protein